MSVSQLPSSRRSRDIANEALSLIDVRYRELPRLATVEDALAEGALLLHENVAGSVNFMKWPGRKRRAIQRVHHEHFEKGDAPKGSPKRMRSSTKPMSSR